MKMILTASKLMSSCVFLIAISFLACLFSLNKAEDEMVSVYEIIGKKFFNLGPNANRSIIEYYAIVDLRPSKVFNNTYVYEVETIDITGLREDGKKVDLLECESSKGLRETFLKPFAAVYEHGKFKHLKVSDGEVNLTLNLKFHLNSIIQLDLLKILGNEEPEFSTETNELWLYGDCPFTYHVEKLKPNGSYTVEKMADMIKCTFMNYEFEEEYLNKACASEKYSRLSWFIDQDYGMKDIYTETYDDNTTLTELFSYRPFQGNQKRCYGGLISEISLLKELTPGSISEEGINIEIKKPVYTKVNKAIFEDDTSASTCSFRMIYQALACMNRPMNPFLDLQERIIKCEK